MDLSTLDLNLLKVFDAVMQRRSITLAGIELGLSQSAASNALRRLRAACKDQLFVRTVTGMVPTSLAMEIADPVHRALAELRGALGRDRDFDPSTSERRFQLLMTDVGDLMFLPPLMKHLSKVAPKLKISCRQIPREQYGAALEAGTAEIALGMLPMGMRDFGQQRLRDELLVCVASRANRAVGDKLTLKQFLAADHVAIVRPAMGDKFVVQGLGADAVKRNVLLEVQHYLAVPMILKDSQLLAVLPQTVANALAAFGGLRILELPFPTQPLPVKQYWHRRWNNDAGHRWLRSQMASIFTV